jgi:hypothetical protein
MNEEDQELSRNILKAVNHLLHDVRFDLCVHALTAFLVLRLKEAGIPLEKIEPIVKRWIDDLNHLSIEQKNHLL